MIQQTARAISLEMALRDMIAAGYKVQLSAETSAWFDDDARVITLVDGTQLDLEVEFVFKELEGPLYTFEMLDTTVSHGKLWSGTMLESHEDVGNEVARLIENVATNYYCSAR